MEKEISDNIIIRISCDAFDRIVFNLLDNAVKYSLANGKIVIMLTIENGEGYAKIGIRDFGNGISPKVLPYIFEPYFQIKSPNKGNKYGMGLGLPMIKKIIESAEGTIKVVTYPNIMKGTFMLVSLPLNKNTETNKDLSELSYLPYTMDEEDLQITEIDPDKYSIMVVEDKKAVLNYLHQKLLTTYNIIPATNGEVALNKLKEYKLKVHLIITDLMMEKMDGHRLLKIISQIAKFRRTPIIVVSAKDTPTDRQLSLNLGAVAFIKKPFNIHDLENQVKNIINATNIEGSLKEPPIIIPQSELNYKHYHITDREMEIIDLLKKGLKNKAISEQLFISINTVNTHISNIYEKVGVNTKLELIRKLAENV